MPERGSDWPQQHHQTDDRSTEEVQLLTFFALYSREASVSLHSSAQRLRPPSRNVLKESRRRHAAAAAHFDGSRLEVGRDEMLCLCWRLFGGNRPKPFARHRADFEATNQSDREGAAKARRQAGPKTEKAPANVLLMLQHLTVIFTQTRSRNVFLHE
ncbi:AraC family transcriptional regulator [Anopheles sinensis]|uniref:AraC family transcriptional regulator n=1 Tax=Anopheles sinensis TaxID=74873 RepID=A0A084VFB4_ANOSI|nr:AraC family transcriptional regulator [Anopheles sinensis]